MKFYDCHVHFAFRPSRTANELKYVFSELESSGLLGFGAIAIAEYPTEVQTIFKMVPRRYHEYSTLEALEKQEDPFPLFQLAANLKIIPYLDARFIERNIEDKIGKYKELGFKGLKLLYVPERDDSLEIGGMYEAFRRNMRESERITWKLVENAASYGMPVLVHVDLRKYGAFISDMVKSFPNTNFNIAHFGFSRRAVRPLLENYQNCYTDMAGLLPYMKQNLDGYVDFIEEYSERVLFGSDSLIEDVQNFKDTSKFIQKILPHGEVLKRVCLQNFEIFHQGLCEVSH